MSLFRLCSDFKPSGDQPAAIAALTRGVREGRRHQTLLGVTGSGKTFTVASALAQLERPALVLSPNKVLAAQLYAEFKSFFPHNAVEYFISYYDYYQPEAYVPSTDTYIEKDSSVNEHIDKLRLKATSSLLSRRDVIVVASVSCIYNIGSPENYKEFCVRIEKGMPLSRGQLLEALIASHYERNEVEFAPGRFRAKGAFVDVFPAGDENALRVEVGDSGVRSISVIHPLTADRVASLDRAFVYPAKHFVTRPAELERALGTIATELEERVAWFKSKGKELEAQRIQQRVRYDMEMLKELGFCHGVENYSRHLTGRPPGARPFCLLDYFPEDYLLIVDESHVSVPQVRGMYEGDRARKQTLVDFGFRLPSALDNRPLKFEEFEALGGSRLYVSATPGPYELTKSGGEIIEQVIRPTGLVDPVARVVPTEGQIPHLIGLIEDRVKRKERALVLTLTKRTAEDLCDYLVARGLRVRYLHSDIDSLTRIGILQDLRKGNFDVLVGINLLREGLDLPEVSLVAILEAANEGFLRSETTLIQISGRAARNSGGEVVLYADTVTGSMRRAMEEMDRRREKQVAYNKEHKITPKTVQKAVVELAEFQSEAKREGLRLMREAAGHRPLTPRTLPHLVETLERQMKEAADSLDFELAALLRDQLFELKEMSPGRPASAKGRRPPPGTKRPTGHRRSNAA
ncbi:MAG TPA: excinuclease ABC subunit UvrB [Elusimicrobiota bacterium]|jgi:excinuclease ABC subunit B|nr:excinuclease ABC subunit UvrB [Elusimicrobiota bacterium]